MRPIFSNRVARQSRLATRVGVGTYALNQSGLLKHSSRTFRVHLLPFPLLNAAVGSSLRGDGSGFVSTGASDSSESLAATVTGSVSSLLLSHSPVWRY